MAVLSDVSKMITGRQRKIESVESFIQVYRFELVEAQTEAVRLDLDEGQPEPDVLGFVDSLVRRLRREFDDLVDSEMRLLAELKGDAVTRILRDRVTGEARESFFRSRSACRAGYGLPKSVEVGYPLRLAQHPLPLLRQMQFTGLQLRDPKIDLGDAFYKGAATSETLLGIFEPKAAELREAVNVATRSNRETQGTQVIKDSTLRGFDRTYSLIVRIVEGMFNLAGKSELAKRFRPVEPQRSANDEPGEAVAESPSEPETPTVGEVAEPAGSDDDADVSV